MSVSTSQDHMNRTKSDFTLTVILRSMQVLYKYNALTNLLENVHPQLNWINLLYCHPLLITSITLVN